MNNVRSVQPIHSRQRGLTLIELIIFILLLGVAFAVIFTQAGGIQGAFNSYAYKTQLETVVSCIESRGKSVGSYTGISSLSLVQTRCAPTNMINGNTLQSEFGPVVINPQSLDGGNDNAYSVSYAGVPPQVCSNLVSSSLQSYRTINVAGVAVKDDATPNPATDAIEAACAPARNTIEFIGT